MLRFLRPALAVPVVLMACTTPSKHRGELNLPGSDSKARSYFTLTTGNGLGFTLFDVQHNKLFAFLDHPYRYLSAAADEREFGPERRNLLENFDFSVGGTWLSAGTISTAEYLDQTGVIHIQVKTQAGEADQYFSSPFGLKRNAVLALVRSSQAKQALLHFNLGDNPKAEPFWESPFKVASKPGDKVHPTRGAWVQTGTGRGAIVYVPLEGAKLTCNPKCESDSVDLKMNGLAAHDWLGVVIAYVDNPKDAGAVINEIHNWIDARSAEELLKGELDEWATWRRPPGAVPIDLPLWRQSEAVLRMAQVREPVSNGMILAAIAPGGWSIGWVRDGAYATVALARTGHFAEAKRSLDFFLNAKAGRYKQWVDGVDYRISLTRYYGNGVEEVDYAGLDTPNIETDGWGLFLWAARQYVQASGNTNWLKEKVHGRRVIDILRGEVVGAIESQLEKDTGVMRPDSSIWEVHQQNAKHFLYTTVTAARGLCDYAWLTGTHGDAGEQKKYAALFEKTRAAIGSSFLSPEGFLLGAKERSAKTDLDAATFEYFNLADGDAKSELGQRTLRHLEMLRTASGGYARNGGADMSDRDEWVFVDLRAATLNAQLGNRARAEELLSLVGNRAHDNFNMVPEMYNSDAGRGPLEVYHGSTPMVGYGSGLYLITQLDLASGVSAHDCGGTVLR